AVVEGGRDAGRARLETAGEAETVGGRHAHFFAALADRKAQGRGHGVTLRADIFRTNPEWLEWLALERANLTTALAWLIEQRETEDAVQLIQSIWRVWLVRGPLRDGRTWTEQVLALDGVERSPDFGWLLSLAADFPRFSGDPARARALLERSIDELSRTGEEV